VVVNGEPVLTATGSGAASSSGATIIHHAAAPLALLQQQHPHHHHGYHHTPLGSSGGGSRDARRSADQVADLAGLRGSRGGMSEMGGGGAGHPAGNITGLCVSEFLSLPPGATLALTVQGDTDRMEAFLMLRKL
jgi:hypothetical protein